MKDADEAIIRAREEFNKNVSASETQIKKVVADFSEKSETLRNDAIKAAIATLDSQLKEPMSTLSNTINKNRKHMETLGRDVETLEKRRVAIDDVVKGAEEALPTLKRLGKEGPQLDALMHNFDNFKAKEQGISNMLQNANETVNRIKEEVPKLDTIIRELKDIEAKEKALSDSLTSAKTLEEDAKSHAHAAKQSANLAETARSTVMSAIETLQKEATSQEFSLGGTTTRIEGLTKNLAEAETKFRNNKLVASNVASLNEKISLLTSHVDNLEARLLKLEKPSKAVPLSLPQLQAELSPQQWFEIQQNLAARGFNPGKVDGRPGYNTRRAIRLFQGATNQPVTGILTATQIEQLLTRP